MHRRTFFTTGTVLSFGLVGCLDNLGENENSDTKNESKIDNETEGNSNSSHDKPLLIQADHVEEDEVDRDTDDICEFEDLTSEVQEGVRTAIEEGSFTTNEPAYGSGHECYGAYIHYEGEYYKVVVAQ